MCECVITDIPLEWVTVRFERHGVKAYCVPNKRLIVLDPDFFRSVPTSTGRAAVIFHEWAHVRGATCEPCADIEAGLLLKAMGFNLRDAGRTYHCTITSRPNATRDLIYGYQN